MKRTQSKISEACEESDRLMKKLQICPQSSEAQRSNSGDLYGQGTHYQQVMSNFLGS